MKAEDNRHIYKGEDAFLRLYELVSASQCQALRSAVICVLDPTPSELGTGRGSYAVILLVSLLGSLTIAKCIGLSERSLRETRMSVVLL